MGIHKMVFKCMEMKIKVNRIQNEVKKEGEIYQSDLNTLNDENHEMEQPLLTTPSSSCPKSEVIASTSCEVCGRHFLGEYSDSLKVDHLCVHFQADLLADLRDIVPPYKCPSLNCDFKSSTLTIWIYHYATVHNMIQDCLKTYLDNQGHGIIKRLQHQVSHIDLCHPKKNQKNENVSFKCKCATSI